MAKRRGKSGKNLRRIPGDTLGRDLILIVVEGKKTEPQYFESMRQELKLATAKIEIVSASGGDPLEVVEKAQKCVNKKKFEKVFCVFDYDNKRDKYEAALKATRDYNFETPITSIPCFEFWYLLHCRYSDRPFQDCNQATKEVQKELQKQGIIKTNENYQKKLNLYESLRPQLQKAIAFFGKINKATRGRKRSLP
ncbi:MAG: RloB family protein [Cyanobacteriota bacterium]|nr:RloB family protein [Cyanobacteriota bacterium]